MSKTPSCDLPFRVGAFVGGIVLAPFLLEACIIRATSFDSSHIALGNQFTLSGRGDAGFSGGVVSLHLTAPGTATSINFSGVAVNRFPDGSGWILATNHPNGDLSGAGYGPETVTVGLAGNYLTSSETQLTVSRMVVLSGSGSRDLSRRDLRLYFVPTGLPPFGQVEIVKLDDVPTGVYLHLAGFGQLIVDGAGQQPTTGDVRGFRSLFASRSVSAASGASLAFYAEARVNFGDGTNLLGRGASGDSGGGVFYQERLCGVMEYSTNNSSVYGFTGFNYFTQALIDEINQITACPADVGQQGGVAGSDGVLDNNDFIAFIDAFFAASPLADRGMQGGARGSDGTFDNNDFIVFIDQFFAGCG